MKKSFGLLALGFAFLIPSVNAAPYWTASNFSGDGRELSSTYQCGQAEPCVNRPGISPAYTNTGQKIEGKGQVYLYNWYSGDPTNLRSDFSVRITTTELEADADYVVKSESPFGDTTKTYKGSELNAGVEFKIANPNGEGELTITKSGTTDVIQYFFNDPCSGVPEGMECNQPIEAFNSVTLKFNSNEYHQELVDFYNELAPNKEIELNSVDPGETMFAESIITSALREYEKDGYTLYGYNSGTKSYIDITKGSYDEEGYMHQIFEVTYKYQTPNESVKAIVDDVASKLDFTFESFNDINNYFIIEDLENINYRYSTSDVKDISKADNLIVNYSSKIHNLVGNAAVDFIFDIRAGFDGGFINGTIGPMNIVYNGMVYNNVDPVGFVMSNVIYVPDDTETSREAFIEAAKTKIESYLKNVNVEITYGGNINDLDEQDYKFYNYGQYISIIDTSKSNGEWYNVKLGDKTYKYIICKDSSKMNVPFVNTKDINSNVYVTTESFQAPLDSKVSAKALDKNSDEFKSIIQKLGVSDGLSYDFKMYSGSVGTYISKLDNGNFRVYIPATNLKEGSVAYYLKDDGTREEYKLTFTDDGYAWFETNHFSIYTITDKISDNVNKTMNPETGDSIIKYIAVFGVCILGIGAVSVYMLKSKKN